MDQTALFLPFGPIADTGAAGLEVEEVGAGGDLAVGVLPRQPDLDIVGLGRREAEIATAEVDDPVRQLEKLQHLFGITEQGLEFVPGILRTGELDQLDLLELMLANQAAGILAVGPCLGTKAGGVGGILDRQVRLVDGLSGKDIGHRYLGGGDQPQVPALELEQVFLEFGQLAGAGHSFGVDHERRQHLGVAVALGVEVDKEADQSPGEAGAEALEQGKAGPGQAGGGFEIKDALLFADFPVGQRRKGEFGNIAPAFDLHVVRFIPSLGDRIVREVGDRHDHILQCFLNGRQLAVDLLDPLRHRFHLGDHRFGLTVLAGLFEAGNGLGNRVALVFQRLCFGKGGQAATVDCCKSINELRVNAAEKAFSSYQFQVFPDKA